MVMGGAGGRGRRLRLHNGWGLSGGLLALVVVGPFIAGCGGRPAGYPETAPVSGRVTLDGEPLEGASVSFIPAAGRSSSGQTDSSGRYQLYYTGRIKGAMLGKHRVSISRQVPDQQHVLTEDEQELREQGHYQGPQIESLPPCYHGSTSELTAEVTAGRNTVDFALRSAGEPAK